MTNDQVGAQLRLSKRTVDAHLEQIRNKLDVHSRVEIAAWVRSRAVAGDGDRASQVAPAVRNRSHR